jgi:hypothetical protein
MVTSGHDPSQVGASASPHSTGGGIEVLVVVLVPVVSVVIVVVLVVEVTPPQPARQSSWSA